MNFATPQYSKNQVNRAGRILVSLGDTSSSDMEWARQVLSNWRAIHAYPLNTFQATLRRKLREGDYSREYIVAQRLKRSPSIITKLRRFPDMQLARMQDIGGLRAIVQDARELSMLHEDYMSTRFLHVLKRKNDYVAQPKDDGYRSIHLVYRYQNKRQPIYNGLHIELQLRTKVQHAWATAVETIGTFLNQALKSGEGEEKWREFFLLASGYFSCIERTPKPRILADLSCNEIRKAALSEFKRLDFEHILTGFSIATDMISQIHSGYYHLIILDLYEHSVQVKSYSKDDYDNAINDYSSYELEALLGRKIEVVLTLGANVNSLRAAYPNYFLDTKAFINLLQNDS